MPHPPRRADERDHTITWIAAGTVVGLIAGALVAERMSGRALTLRVLLDRGRALASRASTRWEPLVEAAIRVRDAWEGNGAAEEVDEEVEEEALDDDVDGDEVDDEADDDLDEDDELDDDLEDDEDEDLDEDDEDDDDLDDDVEALDDEADDADVEAAELDAETSDTTDAGSVTAIDERVLEAFSNDPVLAECDVEIEEAADATIVLHGEVRTAREIAHAVTIARGVPGVSSVRQRLTVRSRR